MFALFWQIFAENKSTKDQVLRIFSFDEICICETFLKIFFTSICFRDWEKKGR